MSGMTALERFQTQPHRFSRRLRKHLWRNDTLRMLPDDGYAYGWNDGGCLVLADALVLLLAPAAEIVPIVVDGSRVGDHYVTRVGCWYIDAGGAAFGQDLLDRWERTELLGGQQAGWSTMEKVTIDPGTDRNAELSARIAAHLARVVFDIDDWQEKQQQDAGALCAGRI